MALPGNISIVAHSRPEQAGSDIEITSGLSDGEKVIEKVTDKIQNGTKVKIL